MCSLDFCPNPLQNNCPCCPSHSQASPKHATIFTSCQTLFCTKGEKAFNPGATLPMLWRKPQWNGSWIYELHEYLTLLETNMNSQKNYKNPRTTKIHEWSEPSSDSTTLQPLLKSLEQLLKYKQASKQPEFSRKYPVCFCDKKKHMKKEACFWNHKPVALHVLVWTKSRKLCL